MSFGQRILNTRKEQKLSQEQLAKMLNVKAPVIGRYERDEVKPSIDVAARLANALGISLDYLVGNVEIPFDSKSLKRLEALSNLNEEEQRTIYLVLDSLLRDFQAKKVYEDNN